MRKLKSICFIKHFNVPCIFVDLNSSPCFSSFGTISLCIHFTSSKWEAHFSWHRLLSEHHLMLFGAFIEMSDDDDDGGGDDVDDRIFILIDLPDENTPKPTTTTSIWIGRDCDVECGCMLLYTMYYCAYINVPSLFVKTFFHMRLKISSNINQFHEFGMLNPRLDDSKNWKKRRKRRWKMLLKKRWSNVIQTLFVS